MRRFPGSEPCAATSLRETVNYPGPRAWQGMRFRFEMVGDVYSKHKESFKRLLAKHGLRWRGSLDRPFWASGTERVTAVFDRDEERDLLRSAALVWESAGKSRLLEDLKAWAWEAGAKAVEDQSRSAPSEMRRKSGRSFHEIVHASRAGPRAARSRRTL